MRIAQVCHNYLPHIGGVEFYVKRIIESLDKKGIAADVLTTDMATPEEGRKAEAKYFKTSFAFMRNPFSLGFVRYLRKNRYDVLHLHSVWFLHSLIAVYCRRKARIIATIHGVYPDNAGWLLKFFLTLYKPFVQYILTKAEKVFVYSRIEEEKLKRYFTISPGKIGIIPMAINIEEAGDQPREKTILFTGRIIPDKNPELLIKAAAMLDERFQDFRIVFVGSVEENYKEALVNLSRSASLKNEMEFVGQLDPSIPQEKERLMNYYRTASVFVSIGSWEGQPTRLMEAMQFRTPVIAFAAGGTADFVTDGKNGLVIKDLDPGLLAEKLALVLSNPGLARQLGEEARRTIEAEYSWDKAFEKIFGAYTGVISK